MFTLKFGITLFYGGLSFVVYFMTIFMVRKYWKEFSISFFRLYIAFFVFNLLTFLNSFITVRIPQNTCKECFPSTFFKSNSQNATSNYFPLNIFYTIHWSMAFVQYSMIMLISINRFSMIFFMTSYNSKWNKAFPFIIFIVAIFPISQTYPIFLKQAYFDYTESLDCYATKTLADTNPIYNYLLIFMALTTVITALANILAFFRLQFLVEKIPKGEQNLMFVSLAMFIVQLFAGGNTMIIKFMINDMTSLWAQVAVTLLPFTSDGLTLIHPWILLMFSRKVRSYMIKMYFPKYYKSSTVTVMSTKP
ncbi:unnamed protein product [Caenorhabditis angaria]|uniref:Serpentine receptor class gamma n=1 Tax=Caenorhabditis angaria TaxID=860376 RepID=A0A9P1ITW5_9PELO|nr:unnamed protein product [Caenorhabditis angaria]